MILAESISTLNDSYSQWLSLHAMAHTQSKRLYTQWAILTVSVSTLNDSYSQWLFLHSVTHTHSECLYRRIPAHSSCSLHSLLPNTRQAHIWLVLGQHVDSKNRPDNSYKHLVTRRRRTREDKVYCNIVFILITSLKLVICIMVSCCFNKTSDKGITISNPSAR